MERRLRIGELSAKSGVSADLLRAWERRYDLLRPGRSQGGYRLYSSADEERVRAMVRHLRSGVPAGEAARLVLDEDRSVGPVATSELSAMGTELRAAVERFDDAGTQAALDTLTASFSFETIAREVILPYLRELGERWERGEVSVAQEHFATVVLRGRLLAFARGWDRGAGPRALLACAPEERHELGLLIFGLALRQFGWRITYLGADTPIDTLIAAAADLSPAAVVLVALTPEKLEQHRERLRRLGKDTRLLLGGSGAQEGLADAVGAELMSSDPLGAANDLAGG
ncbi:MAG TPA: MerR family transcriptional regulator [Solirubrobacterales bacterium]|nr:MerR family transcriptional regulator [Solirubrobacterales bacterium]